MLQRNGGTQTLLVGMQNGTATLKTSLALPHKTKHDMGLLRCALLFLIRDQLQRFLKRVQVREKCVLALKFSVHERSAPALIPCSHILKELHT